MLKKYKKQRDEILKQLDNIDILKLRKFLLEWNIELKYKKDEDVFAYFHRLRLYCHKLENVNKTDMIKLWEKSKNYLDILGYSYNL